MVRAQSIYGTVPMLAAAASLSYRLSVCLFGCLLPLLTLLIGHRVSMIHADEHADTQTDKQRDWFANHG